MAVCVAACPRFTEIAGIAVYIEDHVTCIEGEDGIILGCNVIQELCRLLECLDGGVS